ncbi:MAG: methionine adenosyltransferase [Candidatus Methanomethylophilaceae archaeon]
MTDSYLITSESVTEGHPDKLCDQISDAVLDAFLKDDPMARVACESVVTTDRIFVMGEITSKINVDFDSVVRDTVKEAGYHHKDNGFCYDSCQVLVHIKEQSPDIAMGVNCSDEEKVNPGKEAENQIGAGDQGMMYGYACNETPEFMPLSISMAHKLSRQLAKVRKDGTLPYLRPDGKTQVTIRYVDDKPASVDTVVVSAHHDCEVDNATIRKDLIEKVIKPIIPAELLTPDTKYYINPTGRFVVGGPQSDVGLTGRKIIVDTYGGIGRVGGGSFSGKDPTKVDRSGAYAARYVAKNVVAAGLADKCEVAVAYAIGVANPVSVWVNTFGTAKVDEGSINKLAIELFDWRPQGIISYFNLRRPIYRQVAAYGHFGRDDLDVPWEKTDLAEKFQKALE